MAMDGSQYLLSSLGNALEIMDLLSAHKELSLTEISGALKLGKASVYRMLYTLEAHGYVRKSASSLYSLSLKFVSYSSMILDRIDLIDAAAPFMRELRDRFNFSVHLATLSTDGKSIFIHKEKSLRAFQMSSQVGYTIDAYLTATGKILLAHLPGEELDKITARYSFAPVTENTIRSPEQLKEELRAIRENGYSMDREESEIGLTCIAAPVYNLRRKCVAAVSVSGGTQQLSGVKDDVLRELMASCAAISAALGG